MVNKNSGKAKPAKRPQLKVGRSTRRALHYEWLLAPFQGLNRPDADQLFIQIGKDHGEKFKEQFGELQQMLRSVDPLLLLSILSFLSHFGPSDGRPQTSPHAVLQHHVELFQGLVLQSKLEDFAARHPIPPQMQRFINLVRGIEQSFPLRRYAELDPASTDEQRHRARLIETIRSHTQSVRNWGYPQQIYEMVTDLFAPLEDEVEESYGVRVEWLVEMCASIISTAQNRINEHLRLLLPALRARTIVNLVKQFQKSFPACVPSSEELVKYFWNNRIGLQEAKIVIVSYSDQFLPAKFAFSIDDFRSAYPKPVDPKALEAVLQSWSLSFGDLAGTEPEHLFMNNPVWTKPFIRFDDGYFVPIVGLTLSFCLEMMERVIWGNAHLRARYERRRGKFLEDKTRHLFQEAFPKAEIYQGSLWTDPSSGKTYENDLLVVIDSFLIIVEAKASKVSAQTRRGAKESLQSSIRTLVIDSSEQSKRFADHLQNKPGVHCLSTRNGGINTIDTSRVQQIIRLSVTFDRLGPLQASSRDLCRAGLVPPEIDLSPSMHLADLEIVFDTLERSSEKLHYFARRAEFESHAKYIADETDLLALYLDTGLNLREKEFDGTLLIFYGLSGTLDPYFMRQWTGSRVGKPKRRYSKWWKQILDRIETRPMPGWSEIGGMILNVSYEEQVWFEREFLKCQKLVASKAWIRGQNNAFFCLAGAPQKPTLIIGLAYKGLSRNERSEWLEEGALRVMESHGVSKAVVIGVDVEKHADPYPYDVLCVVMKSEGKKEEKSRPGD